MEEKKKIIRPALGRGLSSLISGTPVPVAPHRINPTGPTRIENLNSRSEVVRPSVDGNLAADLTPSSDPHGQVQYVKTDLVINNPKQPRQLFDEAELKELSDSIKTLGVLQPILVRPSADRAGYYEIVAGERRWRAAKASELKEVPVIIHKLDDKETLEISIVENVQRSGLNPMEEAEAYERLMTEFGLGQKEVSERVGKDRTTISNITRLLKLPKDVQELVRDGKLSLGHAKAILTIKEPAAQNSLAKKVIKEGLSVRELEAIVSRAVILDGPRAKKQKTNLKESAFPEIVDRLRNSLGTKVNISHKKGTGSGKIEIDYYSEQELERIIERICGH